LLPETKDFEDVVHVIDILKTAQGGFVKVVADPQSHNAICF